MILLAAALIRVISIKYDYQLAIELYLLMIALLLFKW